VSPPDAYQRLLHDALLGDPTLFISSQEVEIAWRLVQPVIDEWAVDPRAPVAYPAGAWGPVAADELLAREGRHWRKR
jgi:glucose-6-phosphate 1-dehydrogenase